MRSDTSRPSASMADISHNPLLQTTGLPAFIAIRAEHIRPAVEQVLERNRSSIEALVSNPKNLQAPDWDSLMRPLDEADDRLDRIWSTASHLNGVMNTPDIREAYNDCQPMITEYYAELGQNQALFQCVERLHARADELQLDGSQRKIIRDALLDFRLGGVSLDGERKKQFMALETRLSTLSNQFGNNVLDATRAWSYHTLNLAELAGLPQMTIEAAAAAARDKKLDGYLLTLDFPCYFAVMHNADEPALREAFYRAYGTRASDQDAFEGRWDNRATIDEILSCRAQLAELLDFDNYAGLSVARKMAASAERVSTFLQDLVSHSLPAARREYQQLGDFARQHHGLTRLNAWDVPYYSEKLRKHSFDLSQEELRPWFPVERVKQGLFDIVGRLYGVTVTRKPDVETWHPQAEFYEISRNGQPVAAFFLDLYTREGKRGGAWMAECRNRRQLDDGQWQRPVAYLVCNFAPPTGDSPSLLTHSDVTTLFHEFGHGLHHMLTSERYLRSAGIRGVAWDAVELPSQLMENWCWEPQALELISGHYQSGEPLPAQLLEKMLAARNFQAGMKSLRQLEFALFDFLLHQSATAVLPQQQPGEFVAATLAAVRRQAALYEVPDYYRFQNSFSHIFAGGYAAGYYSYKWAEVLSADVYSRFSASGVFNSQTGQDFLDKVLSRGGGADALELFSNFMGREPDLTALLEQDGLLNTA